MFDQMMQQQPGMGGQDEQTMRRQALSRILMQNVPQEAYRTPQGTAMGGMTQAVQGLAQNPQFLKWIQGQFSQAPGAASAVPMASTGMAAGPV